MVSPIESPLQYRFATSNPLKPGSGWLQNRSFVQAFPLRISLSEARFCFQLIYSQRSPLLLLVLYCLGSPHKTGTSYATSQPHGQRVANNGPGSVQLKYASTGQR